MYSLSTRNEFIRLRVQGLSLAAIGRRLNISKPTAIKWNRQCHSEIAAAASHLPSPTSHLPGEIAALTRRLTALKQELFSRALRDIPTAALETIAGELRQRLESLQPGTNSAVPPTAVAPNGAEASPRSAILDSQSSESILYQPSTPQPSTTSEPIRT